MIEVIEKDYCVAFNGMGPLAFPGYAGSGLCETCGSKDAGLYQELTHFNRPECYEYKETWISKPGPPATVAAAHLCQSEFSARTNGPWTATF